MKIEFNLEPDNTYSALSFDVVYRGLLTEELYWADINPALGGYMVRWQDSYNKPIHCDTFEDAKQHVIDNYSIHTPHINGKQYGIEH